MSDNPVVWYFKIICEVLCSLCLVIYYILRSWIEFFYVPRKNLAGEIVFLTGAAGGFGSLIAQKLAKKGCTLVLVDINQEALNNLTESLKAAFGDDVKVYPFKCDITNVAELENIAKEVIEVVGHPTMLINNAGILSGKYFTQMSLQDVHRTFSVNTFAHYYTVKQFLPNMLENNHGHIVSVSSILGMDSVAGVADYGPSKSAATAMMHALRQELRLLGKDKVYLTNVLPYKANTLLFKGVASRFKWFPILETQKAEHVTNKIIEAIEKNQVTVYVPRILYFAIALLHMLPDRAFDYVYDFLHVNEAMATFVGRGKEN